MIIIFGAFSNNAKEIDNESDHLTAVSSSPTLSTCETSQVLLAGVPGGFSRGCPVFCHLLICSSHMSYNNLERDVKLD